MSIFRVERAGDGIVHLVMDDPARKVNVLDEAALAALEAALAQLERDPALRGVVLLGKPGSFIAGADIDTIAGMTDPAQVVAIVRRAHVAFGRLAALQAPTVAAIDGVCLGGGTELALACDSRIATDEPHTQIGLPEVMLGIFPAFGGVSRLPRLVGLSAALDLILTGRNLDARRAEKAGLIARAVPAAWLIEHAHRRLAELEKRPRATRRDAYRPRALMTRVLDTTAPGRALVFRQARATTLKKTEGRYPAPLAALDVIQAGIALPIEQALALEEKVADLIVGPVCKNLIRIFLLSERAKKASPVADRTVTAAPVRNLALIGTGVMGAGIAELASRTGIRVRMRDVNPEALGRALRTVRGLIDERGRKRRAPAFERDGQMARITVTVEMEGLGTADAAIEAVVEDLEIKRRVFGELEARMRPAALLATNTSSLSVDELAAGLAHPERFCGFHFFNPVHKMPLVEVVRGARTSDAALVSAVALARRLGKTPVVTADSPGFVVNRILTPYLREGMHLLEEGYAVPDIDAAMRRFGMPMGPFELLDEVGIDVANRAAAVLGKAFPERMAPAPVLATLVQAGRLGKKSGAGFYRHRGRKRETDPALATLLGSARQRTPHSLETLAERMTLAMINESAWCLDDGIVADAGMLDLAVVFGTGFPPWRGGPLRHADALGLANVEARLNALRAERGDRFRAAAGLVRRAQAGETFTGEPAAPPARQASA